MVAHPLVNWAFIERNLNIFFDEIPRPNIRALDSFGLYTARSVGLVQTHGCENPHLGADGV